MSDTVKNKNNQSEKQEKIKDQDFTSKSSKEEKKSSQREPDEKSLDYKDQYFRLLAEFENARKRMEREKVEFIKYANEGLVVDFLGILDDLERSVEAAKANHEDYTAFLKGIEMVMAHVYELLKKNNVQPIESIGKVFDPHTHEALMQEETDQHEDGVIIEELQKGYLLADRVVRTAKVKIAKKLSR